jgi:hypothetical protein
MTMRLRILRSPPISSVDGIRLDYFQVGREYDLGNSVGSLFLAEGWAEPLPLDTTQVEPFSPEDPNELLTRVPRSGRSSKRKTVPDVMTQFFDRDVAADEVRFPRRRRLRKR